MNAPDRLDREFCARGFIRAAQYFANMLASADVLAEGRDLVRSIFAPDLVCYCECAIHGAALCHDCPLAAANLEVLRRAVDQAVETGFMALETIEGPPPVACVVIPVAVRGRTETALVVGYAGERELPAHALEALLGTVGLVGATVARQRADRALVVLAEERAARAVAEVTEARTRLLSEASKALFASFDVEASLAALARLLVPQLADWCAVELAEGHPAACRQVALVHVDPSDGARIGELGARSEGEPPAVVARAIAERASRLHGDVAPSSLGDWARGAGALELARMLGLRSAMVVPLTARDATFGAIAFGASARRFGTDDLALAEELGRRAGTAIENARLYRQAQQAIGVRDQFLAIASHELKTPLSALMLVIDGVELSLERIPNAPERMRRKIDVLSRQARRLSQLVTNLLDVARVQAGQLDVEISEVDLCAVVREVAERHEQEAARAGCALELVAGAPVPGAWDENRVDQVVSNLLSNAIKYGAGKPIRLAAEARGDVARLTVADGGIGIAPPDHERIFQRFERAVETGSGFDGMGLGLWITREIVRRLGGSIRVESALGQGARFTVELPMRPDPGPRTENAAR